MVLTLSELSESLGADLAPVWPTTAPDVEVTAVHISELPDPTVFLEGGELLLTTGTALTGEAGDADAFVYRLAVRGIAGLALGLGKTHRRAPEALLRAVKFHGLPLLSVPRPTPFLTITRRYWAMVADRSQRQLVDTLGVHRSLITAALGSRPIRAILRRVAGAVGGWAAHLSSEGSILDVAPKECAPAAHAAARAAGELNLRGLAGASIEVGDEAVLVHPLGAEGMRGYLAIGTDSPLDPTAKQVVMTAVALLTLEAGRAASVRAAELSRYAAVVALLLQSEVETARRTARLVGLELPPGEVRPAVIYGTDPRRIFETLALHREGRSYVGLAGQLGTSCWLLTRVDAGVRAWLDQLVADLPGARAVLGGPVFLEDLGTAGDRVRRASRGLRPGEVVDLASQGSLQEILDAPPARAWAQRRLAPLVEARTDLVATLAAVLRHGRNWQAAAHELGVHRHTVRNRVNQVEQILGVSLDDPDEVAELWLAIRLSDS